MISLIKGEPSRNFNMLSEVATWLQCMLVLMVMTTTILSHEATNPLQFQQGEHHEHLQEQFHQEQAVLGGSPVPHTVERHQPHRAMDRNTVNNEEHLKEHLDGHVKQDEKLSEEEMQFRYFKVHDYDSNNMLDGIELIKALTHHHRSEGEEKRIPDDELLTTIDEILGDNDRNHDGYIDYAEFIVSQRSEDV